MNERTIFLKALEQESPEERAAYLDRACGGDIELRRGVESLLNAHQGAGSFLEHPPADVIDTSATIRDAPLDEPDAGEHADVPLDFLAPPQRPGSLGLLGSYEVTEVVGRGGMGIVLKAFDPKLNRVAAIKVLAPEWASNPTARKRFLREAQAAASIRHDHVVTIYAIEEIDRLPYIAMEFVSGVSLQEWIDRSGPLELQEIVRIGRQTAAGLAAAHAEGLVHRDIKPANILLENGIQRVKITDFGLARAVDDVGTTRTGTVAGTPQYMSPEQARGEYVDHRTDLFSLGCVLYAMCTGRSPFRADSAVAVIRRVCDETPRPIRQINPDIPEWLVAIIDRLLAKNSDDRLQSADKVADVLGDHLQQPGTGRAQRSVRRGSNRRHLAAAALVLLALLAGLGATEATGVTNLTATVIRVVTGEGTLVVETDDPNVSVTIDGEDLVITGAGPKEVRLRPGTYRVRATRDGEPVKEELVRITRGDREVVAVDLIRSEEKAAQTVPPSRRPTNRKALRDRRLKDLEAPIVRQRELALPQVIARFQPGATLETITQDGVQIEENAWKIRADETRTVRLFEVKDIGGDAAENRMLVYRAQIKAEDLEGKTYLEMWVRAPGKGEFFSRDLDDPITGTTGWATYETPFFLKQGEQIDLAKLNLVIEGKGTVWIREIELLRMPLLESTQVQPPTPGSEKIDQLEKLVELAQARLDRMQRLFEKNAAAEPDVRAAQRELNDARIELARARGEHQRVIELLEQQVSLAEDELKRIEMLHEKGAAGASDLENANEALIRARLQLEIARSEARDDASQPPLSDEQRNQAEKTALEAARHWLELVDSGKYGEAWEQTAEFNKSVVSKDQLQALYAAFRNPLGKVLSREKLSVTYTTALPASPHGHYVVIQLRTKFEHGEHIETVIPMLQQDGTWRVAGYFIK